jgi:hypothetical protein
METSKDQITYGSHGVYRWVTSTKDDIGKIIRLCPDVWKGRYLAVTSTDSGEPKWWVEKLKGWEYRGGIGYSPRLQSLEGVLYQTDGPEFAGFDEWYLFETKTDLGEVIKGNPFEEQNLFGLGRIVAFVNFFYSPEQTDNALSEMFWNQIDWIKPESYISDGSECVTFVSRNPAAFDVVKRCLEQ